MVGRYPYPGWVSTFGLLRTNPSVETILPENDKAHERGGAIVSDTLDQVPFEDMGFAENPEPRCPCVLLLDTSGSMQGRKIDQLNEGLREFQQQLQADAMAAKRVEVGIITFGPVDILQPFVTADNFQAPELRASGDTPMGAAIDTAIGMITERKKIYRSNGISFYRPWIFLITDGAPTDSVASVTTAIKEGEGSKAFMLYAVGVDGADIGKLSQIAVRQPLMLKGLSFREMFIWLSNSLGSVSRSQTTDTPALTNPTTPNGWAVAG